MRMVFISLLLLNVLLLIWRFAIGFPENDAAIDGDPRAFIDDLEGVRQLALLKEVDVLNQRKRLKPLDKVKPKVCKSVGPFENEQSVAQFLARLRVLDVKAQRTELEKITGQSHWVLSPAEKNQADARRRLAELKARGVDTYIVPSGELKNRVSLGVFRRMERAQKKLRELSRIGVAAELHSVNRTSREVWVSLGAGEDRKIAQKTWRTLVNEDFSLKEEENFCLDVASGENFH